MSVTSTDYTIIRIILTLLPPTIRSSDRPSPPPFPLSSLLFRYAALGERPQECACGNLPVAEQRQARVTSRSTCVHATPSSLATPSFFVKH